jgi:flavin-binding protein dodecin
VAGAGCGDQEDLRILLVPAVSCLSCHGPRLRRDDGVPTEQEDHMSDRTYRVTEIVGTSSESVQHAVRNGVRRAAQTLRHLDWFEVTEIRGHIVDGDVEHFQVNMKVGFRLEDV